MSPLRISELLAGKKPEEKKPEPPKFKAADLNGWAEFVRGFGMDAVHDRLQKRQIFDTIMGYRDYVIAHS